MRRFYCLPIVFGLCLLLLTSTVSAQSAGWQVVKIELAQNLVGEDQDLHYVTLSPDGTMLAWGHGKELCLYTIDSAETTCNGTPENYNGFGGNYSALVWSPDSRSIAFTESVFDYFYDGDIWVFDVASGTYSDRTDDQYFGDLMNLKGRDVQYFIDYLPFWNPANGDLYFFRSVRPKDGDTTLTLQLMPLGRTEPKQVADFTADFPVFSVFRPASISPDGKKMALIVLGQKLDDPQNGLYLVDLKDGSFKRLLTKDQFSLGLPDWAKDATAFRYPDTAVRWVGNDALVMSLLDSSFSAPLGQSALYIDLASGQASSLTDLSSIPDQVSIFQNVDDLSSPVYRIPRAGVVTPDNSAFIYLAGFPQAGHGVISAVSLPPGDPAVSVQIGEISEFTVSRAASAPPVISTDGTRALLYGYLVTLQPPG